MAVLNMIMTITKGAQNFINHCFINCMIFFTIGTSYFDYLTIILPFFIKNSDINTIKNSC
jgi:hypothetical protein